MKYKEFLELSDKEKHAYNLDVISKAKIRDEIKEFEYYYDNLYQYISLRHRWLKVRDTCLDLIGDFYKIINY